MLGLSQTAMSEQLGVTFQQVQKYENGKNRISAASLFEICQSNNIDIADLYTDVMNDDRALNGEEISISIKLTHDAIRLLNAFNSISSKQAQKAILELAAAMAEKERVKS